MNNTKEEVNYYLKSRRCVIIAYNMCYYISDITAKIDQRWMDIKITQKDTYTEEQIKEINENICGKQEIL